MLIAEETISCMARRELNELLNRLGIDSSDCMLVVDLKQRACGSIREIKKRARESIRENTNPERVEWSYP